MKRITGFAGCLAAVAMLGSAALAETPVLRIAAQTSGTVNWELDTIKANGLDTRQRLRARGDGRGRPPAGQVAFQGGEADAIVSDWIWVARQRAAGEDFVFIPYSKAVGGLMVPADSPAQDARRSQGRARSASPAGRSTRAGCCCAPMPSRSTASTSPPRPSRCSARRR